LKQIILILNLKTRNGKEYFMKLVRLIFLMAAMSLLSGCVLTKLVTVPMRVGAAVVSIVPVVGNPAHDSIDTAAAAVDKVPI
jgi:hypothetical protein